MVFGFAGKELTTMASRSEYDGYVLSEWEMFVGEESRRRESLEAVAELDVRRVLDVGCGAGQELLPFALERGARCVGIDVTAEAGRAGRRMFAAHAPQARVNFARAAAEVLPFADATFDVCICRLALPYTDNARVIAELARVLRPGGLLLLKIHHARYYAAKLWRGLRSGQVLSAVHAARVLAAGSIYRLTGRQPRSRIPSRETFQTLGMLSRELERCQLDVVREMPDTNSLTPSFLIRRRET